jgi:hypothetical protein
MTTTVTSPAVDGFEKHYTEKIWALIPEIYRNEDAPLGSTGPLRGLVELLAGQAAIARRSIDRLWADSRVSEADDWAVRYIGALVRARAVNPLDRTAERRNVARTIYYRRRLGTLRLAETLARDIGDWDAVASEAFRRLTRTWHMLDPGPQPGPITLTPVGGLADLRSIRIDSVIDTAFDDLSHLPDFRQQRGVLGRYNIPKLNLFLFRQRALRLTGVTPVKIADGLYTLDPSGRDVPLFQPGAFSELEDPDAACRSAREWEVRGPIPCRRLNFAAFLPQPGDAPAGLEALLGPIYGRRFATEEGLIEAANAALAADPAPPNALTDDQAAYLIHTAMETGSPRYNLWPGGDPSTLAIALAVGPDATAAPFGPERIYAANLADWGAALAPAGWIEALADPAKGRVKLLQPLAPHPQLFVQRIHNGVFSPIGAGTQDRSANLSTSGFTGVSIDQPDFTAPLSGELRLEDSRTFTPLLPGDDTIEASGDLTLSAANGERPFVVLRPNVGNVVTINAQKDDLALTIDGLWIGVEDAAGGDAATLRLSGKWRQVTLRNVTLDPGGAMAAAPNQSANPIPTVSLCFTGSVDQIVIESSVTGPIAELTSPLDPCATNMITISDSIVVGAPGAPAIALRNASLTTNRTTIAGDVVIDRIDASETLVVGQVLAEDQQTGCFRFSAALKGGRTPHPYESTFFAAFLAGVFVSRRFGDPGFYQLSEEAPAALSQGGEGGVEIGAYRKALDPIKRADLAAKLAEFMPINVIAQQIIAT